MIKRYLEKHITGDLEEKMVFISGPRQVGKTTFSVNIGETFFPKRYDYLNWDNRQDRKNIISGVLKGGSELVIFDEIHKYKDWKNYLKGEYDKYKGKFKIIVTGSSRLDIFRKGGDSLLGRYHSYRLHPLSLNEVCAVDFSTHVFKEPAFGEPQKERFDLLFKFGGFPELFVKRSEKESRRWHNERADRLIKEDIRDIESIRDISALQILAEVLPSRVGSLFSTNSLREDLKVTHKTLSAWVEILEKFYYHYRIYPYQTTLIKSLRKEPKLYLWDWSEIADENIRLENLVASHLLKLCHCLYDAEGYKAQLNYVRDKEQREADFLVSVGDKPWFCVEVKNSAKDVPGALRYLSRRLKVPFVYLVVRQGGIDFIKDGIRVISADKFLTGLV